MEKEEEEQEQEKETSGISLYLKICCPVSPSLPQGRTMKSSPLYNKKDLTRCEYPTLLEILRLQNCVLNMPIFFINYPVSGLLSQQQ